MAKPNFRCVILLALLLPLSATAADDTRLPPVGSQTRAWLELQKEAKDDPKTAPAPMPGEVADKVYQRYVDSFGRPLPVSFPRDSFSSSGSGG